MARMQAIILAAGRGSRLGSITSDKPKLMLEFNRKSIYAHQLARIEEFCTGVTVVLGHGFEEKESVNDYFPTSNYDLDVEFLVVQNWEDIENAATLLAGIQSYKGQWNEDFLVLCGDVLFTNNLIQNVIAQYDELPEGYNAVGYIPGDQNEMTAITVDSEDNVTDYGAISGYQEIGIFILNKQNIPDAVSILESNKSSWFPVVFPQTLSKGISVQEDEQIEINTPDHLNQAREWATRKDI